MYYTFLFAGVVVEWGFASTILGLGLKKESNLTKKYQT
jgi:hypothetical protein